MKKSFVIPFFLLALATQVVVAQNTNLTGNVGIGTTSPQEKLHVVGNTILNGTTTIYQNSQLRFFSSIEGPYLTESYGLRAYPAAPAHAFMVLNQPMYVGYESTGPSLDLQDGSLMVSNKLGIGTKDPTRKLTLNGQSSTSLVDVGLFQNGIEKGVLGLAGSNNDFFAGTVSGDVAIRATTGLLHFGTNSGSNVPAATIMQNGNFGVGTIAPSAKFHSNGTLRFQGLATDNVQDRILASDANGNIFYRNLSNANVALNSVSGSTLIGTNVLPALDAKLAVKGNIYAHKIKVTLSGWADYVFDESYRLRPLAEVEKFIALNHHLPEVPSAVQVEKDGLDLGGNQAILLQKIEELTLYLIEQNKKLESQQNQLVSQQKKLESKLGQLENQQNQINNLKKELKIKN